MFWRKGCKIVPIVFPKKDKFLHKTCSICLDDLNNNYVTLTSEVLLDMFSKTI